MQAIIRTEDELSAAIQAETPGKLIIRGRIPIKKRHLIRNSIYIQGEQGAHFALEGGSFYCFGSSEKVEPLTSQALGESLKGKTSKLQKGDLIFIWSQDKLDDVRPHHANGTQHGSELHMVNWIRGEEVGVESFVVDQFENDPVTELVHPVRNVTIKDIEITCETEDQSNYFNCLQFQDVANLRIENVHLPRNGGGAIVFDRVWDARVDGITIDGQVATDGVYGVVVGAVNNFRLQDSLITGCRHPFTTTASHSQGLARWGTPLNVLVKDNIFNVPTKDNGASRLGPDTHAEGWGIAFIDNLVNLGAGTVNTGMQTRSRNTLFKGNIIRGNLPTKSLLINGPNATVDQMVFEGGWYGVKVQAPGAKIMNSSFRDFSSAAIWKTGNIVEISNCFYRNIGYLPSSGFVKGEIIREAA